MKSKQLILVLESARKQNSDYMYIKTLIDEVDGKRIDVKINAVFGYSDS